MRIKTISVNYERTINLGNYQSAKIGVSAWADLEEGDDPDAAIASVQATCREHARAEYHRLAPAVERNGVSAK